MGNAYSQARPCPGSLQSSLSSSPRPMDGAAAFPCVPSSIRDRGQPVAETAPVQNAPPLPRPVSAGAGSEPLDRGHRHLQLGTAIVGHFSGESRLTSGKGQSQCIMGSRQTCSSGSRVQVLMRRPHIYTCHVEGKASVIPSAVCLLGSLCVGSNFTLLSPSSLHSHHCHRQN